MAVSQLIGARVQRREDPRLITGHGHFTDDFTRVGLAHAAFVRSPHPHALIKKIEVTEASKADGVVAVYTARDFKGQLAGTLPALPVFVAVKKYVPEHFPIAEREVCYQGEIVAVVVAETKAQAADGADLVDVEYEPIAAVMNVEKAAQPGSNKTHTDGPDNICWDLPFTGDEVSEAAFKAAEVVVKERIHQQRLTPTPMETRVRVISADVGGGFGSKISPYPEDYLVPAVSRLLERPVKWNEARTESVQNAYAGRGQYYDVEVAAKKDGTLLGMRVTQYIDVGAYHAPFAAFQPVACLMAGGAYKWKGISARTVGVLTNRVPTDPYRGAGRPEATHLVERMVDLVAGEIGMDPVAIRRKNFIQPKDFPFTQNFGLVVDSGDYEKALNRALELAGYDDLRKQQADLRKKGRYLGIGFSTWIELCGFGPSAATAPATGGIALVEAAQVRVTPTGAVLVYTGTHSHGQGHETTFSQIVADTLGVPMETVDLRHGDTGEGTAMGYGTAGSRSLSVGGVAISRASGKVVDKARKLAAHILEAAEEDIVFDQGKFHVKGSPDKSKTFGEVAFAAYGAGLPEGMEQGLEAVAYFDPPNLVWPFGAHVCVVEVDPETGAVEIQKYVAVDDCGNIINPTIVEGQIHGGVTQGIGQALFEEMIYDEESGQLKTGTLIDYSVPTANEIPNLITDNTVTPSPTNELGVKGIGEAGTIAASIAVINAVCDAQSPL